MIIANKILQRAIAATVANHGSAVVKLVQKYDNNVPVNITIGALFQILVPLFESNDQFNTDFSDLMLKTGELKVFNGKEAAGLASSIITSVGGMIGGLFKKQSVVAGAQASEAASSADVADNLSQITITMKNAQVAKEKNANNLQLAIIASFVVVCSIVLYKKLTK